MAYLAGQTYHNSPNNITHSTTLGLKGHCTSLHSTIARTVADLLKAGNCFRENKQTLGLIWGKKNSSSILQRFGKPTSPLHSSASGYCLFWPLCPFLSLIPEFHFLNFLNSSPFLCCQSNFLDSPDLILTIMTDYTHTHKVLAGL